MGSDNLPPEAHSKFRNQLVQAVLQSEPAVLKVLVEAVRIYDLTLRVFCRVHPKKYTGVLKFGSIISNYGCLWILNLSHLMLPVLFSHLHFI